MKWELQGSQRDLIQEKIKKYGWFVISVDGSERYPAFAFTVGLIQKARHPDIFVLGNCPRSCSQLANRAAEMILLEGRRFDPYCSYPGVLERYSCRFLPVHPSASLNLMLEAALAIRARHRPDPKHIGPMLQLVWPDSHNRFPWDRLAPAQFRYIQPLLDLEPQWILPLPRNQGVWVTEGVLAGEPIFRVSKTHQGVWHFQGKDQGLRSYKQMSLGVLLERHPELITSEKPPFFWPHIRAGRTCLMGQKTSRRLRDKSPSRLQKSLPGVKSTRRHALMRNRLGFFHE